MADEMGYRPPVFRDSLWPFRGAEFDDLGKLCFGTLQLPCGFHTGSVSHRCADLSRLVRTYHGLPVKPKNGAGERNCTVVSAMARPHSAIEPHPRKWCP